MSNLADTEGPCAQHERDPLRQIALSIVIPIKNESENLPLLVQDLRAVLQGQGTDYEIVFHR